MFIWKKHWNYYVYARNLLFLFFFCYWLQPELRDIINLKNISKTILNFTFPCTPPAHRLVPPRWRKCFSLPKKDAVLYHIVYSPGVMADCDLHRLFHSTPGDGSLCKCFVLLPRKWTSSASASTIRASECVYKVRYQITNIKLIYGDKLPPDSDTSSSANQFGESGLSTGAQKASP